MLQRDGYRAGVKTTRVPPSDPAPNRAVVVDAPGMPSSRLPVDPGIVCLDHVGVAVPDLNDAIALYTMVFGGRLTHREHNEDQQIDEAMIAFGDGAQVQLIAPASPDSTIAKFLDRNGPGLQQMAYRVNDLAVAEETLRAAGMRLLYDAPRRGTAGSVINFVHPKDTGGVLVELVQQTRSATLGGQGDSPGATIDAGPAGRIENPVPTGPLDPTRPRSPDRTGGGATMAL